MESHPQKQLSLDYDKYKNKNKKLSSPTRGWEALYPKTSSERHLLTKMRGRSAFLDPDQEKYPVMTAMSIEDPLSSNNCEYNCLGLGAAKVRACQYNRFDIASKAQKLGVEHCGWQNQSPCRKRLAPGPP